MSNKILVNIKELSQLLSIPVTTLYEHNTMGKIPAPVRIGKKLLWRIDEIKQWLEAGAPGREKWNMIKN